MKLKKLKKSISLLLAVFMLFTFVACDKDSKDDEKPTDAQTETKAPVQKPVTFTPNADYVIVRGDLYSSNEDIIDACFYLKEALKKAYNIDARITTDEVDSGSTKEFLIGPTNRKDSESFFGSMGLNDYGYYIASQNAIVICGATPENTLVAVEKFCQDILTYDGKKVQTKNTEMTTMTKFNERGSYDYSSLTVNGILWEDYTLVVSSGADMAGAFEFNKAFGQYTGQVLPIIHVSDLTGEEESIVRIGASYRNGTGSKKLNGYLINTYRDDAGFVLCIDAANTESYTAAIEDLISKSELKIEGKDVTLNVSEKTVYSVTTTGQDGSSNKQSAYMHWALDSEEIRELSDGVTYVEQVFYDDAGLPYRVYTLVVDTNKNRLDMGTSNDDYLCPLEDASLRQHTQQHMEAAVKNGENVIAATNADFFNNRTDPPGNYEPWGFTIKDGVLISEKQALRPWLTGTTGGDRPFFGVDKNGNPLIAMESEYLTKDSRATLEMAVGGAYILVEEGKTVYYPNGMTGVIIHGGTDPRTVVGYREDGTVILMVIDGRQKQHSNGATTLQCSLLMQRFGASDAMLLDGGGSSCMVLRDPATDTYTTANKPSDGNLRKMFNSILVVKK